MTGYIFFKHIHMTAAVASGAFFMLRGLWMMQESSLFNAKLVKVLPHVIDTILLVSAFILVGMMGSFPAFVQVKIVAPVRLYCLWHDGFSFHEVLGCSCIHVFHGAFGLCIHSQCGDNKAAPRLFIRYNIMRMPVFDCSPE
jgi:hypothetical protein